MEMEATLERFSNPPEEVTKFNKSLELGRLVVLIYITTTTTTTFRYLLAKYGQ